MWTGLFRVTASAIGGAGQPGGLATVLALVSIISPLAMVYFLLAKTGKALTEKRMSQSKPEYADYIRRTSGFFPLPPKGA